MKHFVLFITFLYLSSCTDRSSHLQSITGKQLSIDSSIAVDDSVEAYLKPYRDRVNAVLDSTLAFAPRNIDKRDGKLNSSQGNLMADIILTQAAPIFKSRTGEDVDLALMNYGGIRNVISAGPVTARTAYEVMPFENYIVVLQISGSVVREMVNYLVSSDRPQPMSGLQIVLNGEGRLQEVTIQGVPLDEEKTYNLATINYLLEGGGNADFLINNTGVTDLNYLLRNAMIDYFKSVDTLRASVDNRFIQLKNP
ncbi:5'-nucleotidase C-terminal domain-containing protein [Muriicola soli]|uniref:5'-Nucleotidase C-terminal domain-containing protein n=1 Tax=Muriicola soli TaxID=2507538 RepID=A0A411E9I0_9FLAO|nr:5'-nucleotidase [Muriicola soli]QBA64376.1 hypothetical protein EQY75_07445 [Muriicola soli]